MEHKQIHFLSGLPRSGSTVLAALLSQNPEIYASASSPLVGIMHGAKHMWDTSEHRHAFAEDGQIERVLGAIAEAFYAHIDKPIVLDKNRAWPNPENQEMLRMALGRQPKIVCTVRSVPAVLASFIALVRKNPDTVSFIDRGLIELHEELNDENRCKLLMSEQGHVFQSWAVLKMGFEALHDNLLIIDYDALMENPARELARIYDFLGVPPFQHDVRNIANPVQEDDEAAYNMPGMHVIRRELGSVAKSPRDVLGDDLYERYADPHLSFWNHGR